jgi:predicted nucleotidyltransferase
MVDLIVERFQPEKVVLFGSCARGEAGPGSDVDLLVVAESGLPRWQRSALAYRELCRVDVPVDLVVYTPSEAREWSAVPEALVSRALAEGLVLYEKTA